MVLFVGVVMKDSNICLCHNDGKYPTILDGVRVKPYLLWVAMLQRCYGEAYKTSKPTYSDCTMSANFLNYSYFYEWCQNQTGFGKENWQLDKDILIRGNKTYHEDVCVFVPSDVNIFFTNRKNNRGDYPVGVNFHKKTGKYAASCSVSNGKRKHLGLFLTPHDAFLAYKPFKEALCKELALKWKSEIDNRVFDAMMIWEVSITS